MAIANRLARSIYKILAGDSYKELGYVRAIDHEAKIKSLVNQLKALGVRIQHKGHEKIYSVRKLKVDNTGVSIQ